MAFVHNWLSSYLTSCIQYVELNCERSSRRLLRAGVPQGSVFGPLLFLLYMNDLPSVSPSDKFILFADDTTCVTSSKSLQTACDRISVWFNANKLALSAKKTNHMLLYFQKGGST